jgi:hypothetical protein
MKRELSVRGLVVAGDGATLGDWRARTYRYGITRGFLNEARLSAEMDGYEATAPDQSFLSYSRKNQSLLALCPNREL